MTFNDHLFSKKNYNESFIGREASVFNEKFSQNKVELLARMSLVAHHRVRMWQAAESVRLVVEHKLLVAECSDKLALVSDVAPFESAHVFPSCHF